MLAAVGSRATWAHPGHNMHRGCAHRLPHLHQDWVLGACSRATRSARCTRTTGWTCKRAYVLAALAAVASLQRRPRHVALCQVVFVDFALYSPLTRLFAVMRFFVEFPASGGALGSSSVKLVKLWRNLSESDTGCAQNACACVCAFVWCARYATVRVGTLASTCSVRLLRLRPPGAGGDGRRCCA